MSQHSSWRWLFSVYTGLYMTDTELTGRNGYIHSKAKKTPMTDNDPMTAVLMTNWHLHKSDGLGQVLMYFSVMTAHKHDIKFF